MSVRNYFDKYSNNQLLAGTVLSTVFVVAIQAFYSFKFVGFVRCIVEAFNTTAADGPEVCQSAMYDDWYSVVSWVLSIVNIGAVILLVLCIDAYSRRKKAPKK